MRRAQSFAAAAVLAATALSASAVAGEARIAVPSGQDITALGALVEADTQTYRFRFLAPDLASPFKRPAFEKLTLDLDALCADFALAQVPAEGREAALIVISLSAEPVEFGISAPDVEQVFEAFRVENDTCILELF